jgi:hypothetical protein
MNALTSTSLVARSPRKPIWERDDDTAEHDAGLDAFNDGWLAFRASTPCPYAAGSLAVAWHEGWLRAQRASRVRVTMPARPEGYYHSRPEAV